jgi:hypothetical protein
MRLQPALIMLAVFILVVGALAFFVANYQGAGTEELRLVKPGPVFPDLTADEVQKIEVSSPETGSSPMVFERAGEHKWRMTAPVDALADADKVQAVLADFVGLKAARGYETEAFADYELDAPKFVVTATTRDGRTLRVAFGIEAVGVAAAADVARVDPFTYEAVPGAKEIIPHRYARVGEENRVLYVRDDLCPKIDVPPARFREPRLVFHETADRVKPIEAAAVRRVVIRTRRDRETRPLVLACTPQAPGSKDGNVDRSASGWDSLACRVLEPIVARADRDRVRRLLEDLLGLAASGPDDYAADGVTDRAKYGLDGPAAVVELTAGEGGDAATHLVRFGAKTEKAEELVYASSSSRDAVLRVEAADVLERLRKEFEYFRDHRVVTVDEGDVASATIAYRGERPDLVLARRPKEPDKWRLREPVSGRAASSAVSSIIYAVTNLAVEPDGFVAEDATNLAKYGLDNPVVRIALAPKGNDRAAQSVLFGKSPEGKDGLVYAKNGAEPSVVLVKKGVIDTLTPEVRSLRSTALLEGFDRWSAYEIELARGEERLKLRRGERVSWSFLEPEGMRVDYSAPSDFLAAVADLRIRAWPADRPDDYARFGLDPPHAKLAVKTRTEGIGQFGPAEEAEEKEQTFGLLFGKRTPDSERCYVRLPSEPNVYEVRADILTRIDKGTLEFREKLVLLFDEEKATTLVLEGGRADFRADKVPDTKADWLLQQPIPVPADRAHVKELLAALAKLKAKEFICKGNLDDPAYGLRPKKGHPYRKVVVEVEQAVPPPDDEENENADKDEKKEPSTVTVSKTLLVGSVVPGSKEGDRYAVVLLDRPPRKDEPEDKVIFVMSHEDLEKLDLELVTMTVLDVPLRRIEQVTVTHRDGSQVRVAKSRAGEDTAWAVVSHKGVTADLEKVAALVGAARNVTAERYIAYNRENLAKYGLKKPLLKVEIQPKDKLPSTLHVGNAAKRPADDEKKHGQTSYYATGGGIPAIFVVSWDKVKQLDKHVEDVIQRK